MLTTTQKFPIIALAGTISFIATLASFTIMSAPARGQSVEVARVLQSAQA